MDEFQLCIVYRLLLLAFVRPVVGGSSEEGDRVVGYDPPRLTLRLSCPCFWPGPFSRNTRCISSYLLAPFL